MVYGVKKGKDTYFIYSRQVFKTLGGTDWCYYYPFGLLKLVGVDHSLFLLATIKKGSPSELRSLLNLTPYESLDVKLTLGTATN